MGFSSNGVDFLSSPLHPFTNFLHWHHFLFPFRPVQHKRHSRSDKLPLSALAVDHDPLGTWIASSAQITFLRGNMAAGLPRLIPPYLSPRLPRRSFSLDLPDLSTRSQGLKCFFYFYLVSDFLFGPLLCCALCCRWVFGGGHP